MSSSLARSEQIAARQLTPQPLLRSRIKLVNRPHSSPSIVSRKRSLQCDIRELCAPNLLRYPSRTISNVELCQNQLS